MLFYIALSDLAGFVTNMGVARLIRRWENARGEITTRSCCGRTRRTRGAHTHTHARAALCCWPVETVAAGPPLPPPPPPPPPPPGNGRALDLGGDIPLPCRSRGCAAAGHLPPCSSGCPPSPAKLRPRLPYTGSLSVSPSRSLSLLPSLPCPLPLPFVPLLACRRNCFP